MTPHMKTPRDLARPLDRITWRDGQLLTSRDLKDDEHNSDRLRHLHIRYLHRTWGVVEGLSVTIAGGSTAIVSAGYALDIEGRELLLPRGTAIAAPANITASTTMYVVISHKGAHAAHCGCTETPEIDLTTLCPGATMAQAVVQATLTWKTVNEVRPGPDVLLARVLVANGQFTSGADTSVQRHAASMAQPWMWSDVTQTGQTGWRDATSKSSVAIQATIDTSDAGFTATPAYFARVVPAYGLSAAYVTDAGADSFTVVLPPVPISSLSTAAAAGRFTPAAAESAGLAVAWFAIELPPLNSGDEK